MVKNPQACPDLIEGCQYKSTSQGGRNGQTLHGRDKFVQSLGSSLDAYTELVEVVKSLL